MSEAKIRLSSKEREVVSSTELILTKNSVLQKVNRLLAGLQEKQQAYFSVHHLPSPSSPKISKGENYKGLPYLILDYPRIFEQKNILAIRTLFWWGNFFSVTLHLSGTYKEAAEGKILASIESLKANDFFICTSKDQWEHHFETTNYTPLSVIGAAEFSIITGRPFIKIAKKISLDKWDDAEETLLASFQQFVQLLRKD